MHHQRVLVLASVMCTLALAPKSTAQETWYVDTHTCSGTGSGSAFDPFCTIQAGIDAAQDGDTVLVAAGTYRGIGNRAISFDGKAIAVRGTGGPDGCIIDCASRSYGFAFSHQESSGAILDGFTIRNGINSNGGGGIRCVNGSSPTIANCRFTSCSQSGLYCQDSAPTVSRCTFLENHADEGGAICCLSSAPIIILCDIQGNTAEFGGGICVDAGSVAEVTRCTIVGNRAAIVSGPQAGAGGGICCRDSDTHIQWCTIAGNTVGPHSGGAGIASLNANVAVDRCVITENAAAAHPLLVAGSPRDTVASRRMFSDGGGISCTGGTLTATRCILSRNTANQFGGAVCVTSSTAMLDHCTLFANAAADGAAVYASGSGETTGIGCIVWNNINTSGEGQVNGAINLTYCCISGGREGEGNIAEDPCLTECGRHLTEHSPCRSASVTLHVEPAPQDIDGEPLPLGMPVDIGADQFYDTDHDGLPDWWERLYFGHAIAADATADDDGDGATNDEDYRRCGDPHMPPKSLYVATDGHDAWDGTSSTWDGVHGPKATIQAAIDASEPYEGNTVVVANGVYRGPGNRNISPKGKRLTVCTGGGPDTCVIDCQGAGRGFTFYQTETAGTRVRGFSIVNGWAFGGGAVAFLHSDGTLENCRFENNTAPAYWQGGAVFAKHARPTITQCVFGNNEARTGGAIYCAYADPTVCGCTFVGNTAPTAGGIYGFQTTALIETSVMAGNDGTTVEWVSGALTLRDCDLRNNIDSWSAGLFLDGSEADVTRCRLHGNTASGGAGAIRAFQSQLTLAHSTIVGNRSSGQAAALLIRESVATILGCTIADNSSATSDTAGLLAVDSTLTVGSSILWGNGMTPHEPQTSSIGDCTVSIDHSCVQGGMPGVGNTDADPLFALAGRWDDSGTPDDPGDDVWFDGNSRLTRNSPAINAGDAGYGIQPGDIDLDGHARVLCGIIDMGAYEFGIGDVDCDGWSDLADFAHWPNCQTAPYDRSCVALDVDYDGDVDLQDFAALQNTGLAR